MEENLARRHCGNQIRYFRKEAGLTQSQLAQRIGVSLNSVQRYEKNERQPSADLLLRIAEALEVSYIDLILESSAEYQKNTYWGRIGNIYNNLVGLSCGEFAEAFRQCFPQLNEQGQKKLAAYLQDLVKMEDCRQEPMPKPKDKGPGRVAPFANPDPQPPKSGSQDPGKEE